ncbi:hypothetical protein [Spirosoma horti]
MPTWNRVGSDQKIYANIPFLKLEAYGTDEQDVEVAIKEALTCFCLASEEFGLGLEADLEYLGWTKVEPTDQGHSVLQAKSDNRAFDAVLETGDKRALSVVMA